MAQTIVFIHGAWVTPLCWEQFAGYFRAKGYNCLTPTWPFKDKPIEELRRNPPPGLAGLGVTEIVDHYERAIKASAEPPILIGHSFGGLFVQMLLDRGLGRAGVAIDPAPPKGVLPLQFSAFKANLGILLTWRGWERIVHQSFQTFQYAFVNRVPFEAQKAAYQRHVVLETGRIFFQAGLALLDRKNAVRVNFRNPNRAPLLLIAGEKDHVVPAAMNRSNYAKYRGSGARTDFKEFPGRCHWIIAQEGWEEVAGYVAEWLQQLSGK
jgi:pimeloyl-ACP methyl ester carboxylesterase